MDEPDASPPVTDAVRVQILATEHWSLLATRQLAWTEAFSRASLFLTVLSASVVALALVAQWTRTYQPRFSTPRVTDESTNAGAPPPAAGSATG